MIRKLDLQMFAEEGAAAAPPSAGDAAATAAEVTEPAGAPESAPVAAGDILPDGQQVKNTQVAAAIEKQIRRHPELRNVYGKGQPQAAQAGGGAETAEKTIEQRWDEIRNGEFKELYGRDVQSAIRDRFKNAQDQQAQIDKLEPMLKVLRDRAGVGSNDELIAQVMDDDSLYEEAASEQGMTIPAYRQFMQIQQELEQRKAADAQRQEQERIYNHYGKLQQQAEAMKNMYPDFDLQAELKNPDFLRLTGPDVGISVEDAYYAIHHRELAPQMMAYGMQRAKQQMGQTIQAQRQRPAEGAMRTQGQSAAEVRIDPRQMTRAERQEIKRQVRLGKRVSFD